ncbi:extracellular solute-binding protein [Marispirochaeta sp.]|jgi:putative aldouronate transport system substrate-binding protein|uniref:extracellular solute-binding protein n=1 Tax=Marispirochaeta sp. TaxID=2038653 RepID=UPI0029C80CC9|nr:extracellular solute-binding protein [Marispirochaeta sp.]
MKKHWTQIIFILCAVLATLVFLSGCSKAETPSEGMPEKLVYLTNINVDTEKYDINDNPYLDYIEQQNDADIEIINEASSSQYVQKASIIFASGQLPDYVLINNDLRTNFSIWAREGLLLPLDEYINDTSYMKDDILPLSWELSKIDGKIHAIPMQRYDVSPRMTFARQDWLDNLGIDPDKIKTIEDWYQMLKAFTENDPDGNGKDDTYGITGRSNDEYSLYIFLDAFNAAKARLVNGEVLPNYILPEYKEWLKFMQKLYNEGIMDPEYVVNTKQQYWEKIASDKVGAFYHFWSLQEYTGLNGSRENLAAMNPPLRPDGSPGNNINAMPVRHWIAITKNAGNPKKIVDLLDWAFSPDGGTFVHAGIEGMDYETVDNKLTIKPDRKGKSWAWRFITMGVQKTKMDEQLHSVLKQSWGELGLQHLDFSTQHGTYDEISMLIPPFPELADYDLQAQRDEFREKAIIGAIDIDAEWDNFVTRWRSSGGNEWIKLYTESYKTMQK